MPSRKAIVEQYFEGFRNGDHPKILALLTDDVVWEIHGHARLEGKEAFDGEIENDAFEGKPELTVHRLIEDDDTIAAPHRGEASMKGGDVFRFSGVTVLTFEGDLISRVESYVVPDKP